jgi:hypothetical protein
MMKTVSIDGAQLTSLDLYRMALSEGSQEKRLVPMHQMALKGRDRGQGLCCAFGSHVSTLDPSNCT